jgi:hypothetical protein
MVNHTSSYEELEAIKHAGILLGHSGLLDRVYEEVVYRDLVKSGADETDLRDIKTAYFNCDSETIEEILKDNGVLLKKPNFDEVKETLYHSYLRGDYSIEDCNTTVGCLYQRIFGKDFFDLDFSLRNSNGDVSQISYKDIPESNRRIVNRMIVKSRLEDFGFNFSENSDKREQDG